MRLWTLHPRYLDRQGLLAVWREALLAQKVLEGATVGYTRHPQLERFRVADDPRACIAAYLHAVRAEACRRGYLFDQAKIHAAPWVGTLHATEGQLRYEWKLLLAKLSARSPAHVQALRAAAGPEPHPLFHIVPGEPAAWERGRDRARAP
jgi:hypothetical protein